MPTRPEMYYSKNYTAKVGSIIARFGAKPSRSLPDPYRAYEDPYGGHVVLVARNSVTTTYDPYIGNVVFFLNNISFLLKCNLYFKITIPQS